MKISLLGLKVAPIQKGNVEEGIALLFLAHEINVL